MSVRTIDIVSKEEENKNSIKAEKYQKRQKAR